MDYVLWFLCLLFSCQVVSGSLWPHGLQHARSPCLPPSPRVMSKFMSIASVMPSKHHPLSCPHFLLPSVFPSIREILSQLFTSGGQRSGASASVSVLPMNFQGWFPLRPTELITLLSMGLLKVFSSTTVKGHKLFSTQLSLCSSSHNHMWPLERP